MEEKLVTPEMIPQLNPETIELVRRAVAKAVDESDEWIKDIHGPVYLKQGKAEFVEDNYFEFCLSDYVKALTTMEESPCLK